MPTPRTRKTKPAAEAAPETIRTIKGLNKDLTCLDFQFEINKTYTHDQPIKVCESGFHSIEGHPLVVFGFYPPASSVYHDAEAAGPFNRDGDGAKIASAKITIQAEIALPALIQRAIDWVFSRSKPEGAASSTGDYGAASSTGLQGAASSTGLQGAAMAIGFSGRVMGTPGNALFLVHRADDGTITHAWAGIVGQNGIDPNVWYSLGSDGHPFVVEN